MKNTFFTLFKILIAVVLFGKVLNWLLHFSDETNQILNTIMFSLIGISYLVYGFVWENKWLKTVVIACGVFLIVMNFFERNLVLDIIGIVCILTRC